MPNNKLIERFYESIKEEFPNLSKEEINQVCLFPYRYFKSRMSDDDIPDVRIKYLGSWQVFSTPVISRLNTVQERIDRKTREDKVIYPNEIEELNKLKEYVKNNHEVFSKMVQRRNTKS